MKFIVIYDFLNKILKMNVLKTEIVDRRCISHKKLQNISIFAINSVSKLNIAAY